MHFRLLPHGSSVLALLSIVLPAAATVHNVEVANFAFTPANITVAPGDTVHWFRTSGTHTVTSGTGCVHNTPYFNVTLNATTPTFDWVVPSGVGAVPYFCIPHCAMGMTGTITIQSTELQNFVITLDGDQEVPANTSPATGSGTATLDLQTNVLNWNITFSGLQGTQTLAHFHGPALPCFNAGVQITLPLGSPIVGSAQLTPTQAADLLAGK